MSFSYSNLKVPYIFCQFEFQTGVNSSRFSHVSLYVLRVTGLKSHQYQSYLCEFTPLAVSDQDSWKGILTSCKHTEERLLDSRYEYRYEYKVFSEVLRREISQEASFYSV